jgi:hypothetical protein
MDKLLLALTILLLLASTAAESCIDQPEEQPAE